MGMKEGELNMSYNEVTSYRRNHEKCGFSYSGSVGGEGLLQSIPVHTGFVYMALNHYTMTKVEEVVVQVRHCCFQRRERKSTATGVAKSDLCVVGMSVSFSLLRPFRE